MTFRFSRAVTIVNSACPNKVGSFYIRKSTGHIIFIIIELKLLVLSMIDEIRVAFFLGVRIPKRETLQFEQAQGYYLF